MRTILLALVCVGTWAATAAAQDDRQRGFTYQIHDLSFLIGGHRDVGMRVNLPLWSLYAESADERSGEWSDGLITSDRVVDLVRMGVGMSLWEEPGRSLNATWSDLVVRTDPAHHAQIAAFLEYLERTVGREVSIETYEIPADRAAQLPGGTLSREQADELVASGSAVLRGRVSLKSGVTERLRSGEQVSYLGDYNVEVAEDTQIADPEIRVLDEGWDLRFQAAPTVTGDIFVRVAGRRCNLDSLRVFETNSSWVGRLQLPVADSIVISGSGSVPDGGGLVLGPSSGAADELLFLRVRAEPVGDSSSPEAMTILPLFPAGVPKLRQGFVPLGRPTRSGPVRMPEGGDAEPESPPFLEIDHLIEMVRTGVDPEAWETGELSLETAGRFLVIRAPKTLAAKVRDFVAAMTRSVLKNVTLEFRIGIASEEVLREVTRPQADLARIAGLLNGRATVAMLAGDEFLVMDGREMAFVKDQDVEIAVDAAIADPVVSTLFSGFAIRGTAALTGRDRVGLTAELVVQDLVGDVVPFDGNANDIGLVEVPRTATTRANVSESLPKDRWTVVWVAPKSGGKDGLVVLVRARY